LWLRQFVWLLHLFGYGIFQFQLRCDKLLYFFGHWILWFQLRRHKLLHLFRRLSQLNFGRAFHQWRLWFQFIFQLLLKLIFGWLSRFFFGGARLQWWLWWFQLILKLKHFFWCQLFFKLQWCRAC
jgi:hypothetical protein